MINYTESFNFKSIPAITPLDGYWQNGTWKFNMSEITAGASSQPSWQDIILSGNGSLTLTNAKANGLNYLKLFGGTEQTGTPTPDTPVDIVCNNGTIKARHQSGLPLGYTRLEYIEFDGYSYIDTGITPLNSGATINMKIAPSTIANLQFLYGQNPTERMQQVGCFLYTNGKITWQYSASRLITNVVASVGTTYDITLGNGFITINGTTITGTPYTPFTTNMTVLVGAAWNPDYTYVDVRRFVGKVYAFSYKLGGQTLVNLVPAKNSSNVVGMYDLVSEQFFTNAGTGAFTAGDPVSDPVEIYTDGTVETVGITGKNLFDVDNNLLAGYYINNTTGILTRSSDGSSSCFKDFLPSKPNITYTMSRLSEKSTSLRMWAYDKDKNPISSVFNSALGTKEVTGTTPNDTAYIRCSFGSIPQYSQNIQLELGSTATTYEPYFNGGSATAEMLLKVGNYKDVQSILDGGVTRNVGIEVLNGSEDWKTTYQGFFDAPLPNHIATAPAYCNYFQSVTTGTVPPTAERANKVWLGSTWVGLGAREKFSTVADFKQWLAEQYANGTPVIIVYALSTATTETVTPQPLSIQAGTNIVEITQASIDNLPLEVSYKGVI